jgi:hypothetical protein
MSRFIRTAVLALAGIAAVSSIAVQAAFAGDRDPPAQCCGGTR